MLESDPAIKILEVDAYSELILRALINDKARALLPAAAAKGSDLDHLGVYYGVPRLLTPAAGNALAIYETDEALTAIRRQIDNAIAPLRAAGKIDDTPVTFAVLSLN